MDVVVFAVCDFADRDDDVLGVVAPRNTTLASTSRAVCRSSSTVAGGVSAYVVVAEFGVVGRLLDLAPEVVRSGLGGEVLGRVDAAAALGVVGASRNNATATTSSSSALA